MSDSVPASLPAGAYFSWKTRQFGVYTPSYEDGLGSVVGYFAHDCPPHDTYSMTNEEARATLAQLYRIDWLGVEATAIRVLDGSGDVVVLPPGWTDRMLDDPNFRLTPAEQGNRLKPVNPVKLTEPMLTEVRNLLLANKYMDAIRQIRHVLGLNLSDALATLKETFGFQIGTRLDRQEDGSVVVRQPRLMTNVEVTHASLDAGGRMSLGVRYVQDDRPTPRVLGGPEHGYTLVMPSLTSATGTRSLALTEIDDVFNTLAKEARAVGDDAEAPSGTLAWLVERDARLAAVEDAFMVVNELAPSSDWLRDFRFAMDDADSVAELRKVQDRAVEELTRQHREAGRQLLLPGFVHAIVADRAEPERKNCATCSHAGPFTCDLLGSMRSEALTWRTSNTTGDGCPGWEGLQEFSGFQTPSAPAQPTAEVFGETQPDWLPEDWNLRDGVYEGPEGRVYLNPDGQVVATGPARSHRDEDEAAVNRAAHYHEMKTLILALAHPDRVTPPPVIDLDAPLTECPTCGGELKREHFEAHGKDPEAWSVYCQNKSCQWMLERDGSPITTRACIGDLDKHPGLRDQVLRVLEATRYQPTFQGLRDLRSDGFLQELNRLVLHPAGLALALVETEGGRVVDVIINRSPDQSGWGFCPEPDDLDFQTKAANVAREIEARKAARLQDPDLRAVIESVPGGGPSWETATRIAPPTPGQAAHDFGQAVQDMTSAYHAIVKQAEKFLVPNDEPNASPQALHAHDVAKSILDVAWTKG